MNCVYLISDPLLMQESVILTDDVNEEQKRAKRLFNNNQFPALANLTKEMYNRFLN